MGATARRWTRKRKGQRLQRKGQRQGRSRAWKGRQGQAEEVEKDVDRESGYSEYKNGKYREQDCSEISPGSKEGPLSTASAGEPLGDGHKSTENPEAWPALFSPSASDGLTGLDVGKHSFEFAGHSFGEMAEPLRTLVSQIESQCGVLHSKVKCSGGIFPLPENRKVLSTLVDWKS